jgi:hypothetical protein
MPANLARIPGVALDKLPDHLLPAGADEGTLTSTPNGDVWVHYNTSEDQIFLLHEDEVDVIVWDFGLDPDAESPGTYNTFGDDIIYGTVEETDRLVDDEFIFNFEGSDGLNGTYAATFPRQTDEDTVTFYIAHDNSTVSPEIHELIPVGTVTVGTLSELMV